MSETMPTGTDCRKKSGILGVQLVSGRPADTLNAERSTLRTMVRYPIVAHRKDCQQ